MAVGCRYGALALLLAVWPAMAAPPVKLTSDDARCPRYRIERSGDDLLITCPRWPTIPSADNVMRVPWVRVVGWHARCASHVVRPVGVGAEITCVLLARR